MSSDFETGGSGDNDELTRLSKYFMHLLNCSPDIIIFADRDGRIAYCSDTLLNISCIKDFGSIAGKPFQYLYSMFGDEEFVRQGERRFELVKNSLKMVSSEVRIDFSGSGKSRVYNVQSSPMLDGAGEFDGVFVTYYDMTDLRDAEADEYTRIMLDATPLACSLRDAGGGLLDCNREALRMFGLDKKADYALHFSGLSPTFQPDGSRSSDKLAQYNRQAADIGYCRFEWMHSTMQGEPLPVETTLVRVPWKNSYRFAVYSRDLRTITASRRLALEADARSRELEMRMQAAQIASEAKSRFLASMSHEIRTPMNAIIGMSDLMRTDNLDMTQRGFFEDIKKMSKSLLQIINDVLDFSRIEAGRLEIMPVHFNLMELYGNICSMSRFLADSKGLYFNDSFAQDVPHVIFGDDLRIRQVIVNIINNALKYTREGEVSLDVRRTERGGREYIAFVIRDTGIGIHEDDLPKLYNAFYQVDMAVNRGIDGSGLGLPITKNLVSLMDGDIEIKSTYGEGSEFTVLLPLVEGDPAQIADASANVCVQVSDSARVLVVDDSQINLKVAVAYLERHGIHAETALSGEEALMKIKRPGAHAYSIVFMDHMMPGMDGIETTRRIRDYGLADLPIVALTANAVDGIRDVFLGAGMNDFLSKPIDPIELNKALIRWLPAGLLAAGGGMGAAAGGGGDMGAAAGGSGDSSNLAPLAKGGMAPAISPPLLKGGWRQQDLRRQGGFTVGSQGGLAHGDMGAAAGSGSGSSGASAAGGGGAAFMRNPIIDFDAGLTNALNDCKIYCLLLSDFLKDHGADHRKISDAIDADEFAKAHRLAHTLKGTSALLGANRLRQVSFSIETLLAGGEVTKAKMALDRLDRELTSVVDVIGELLPRIRYGALDLSSVNDEIKKEQNAAEFLKLFEKLIPLLESGDTRCLDYGGQIRSILPAYGEDAEALIGMMENFDFTEAGAALKSIRSRLSAAAADPG